MDILPLLSQADTLPPRRCDSLARSLFTITNSRLSALLYSLAYVVSCYNSLARTYLLFSYINFLAFTYLPLLGWFYLLSLNCFRLPCSSR